MCAGGKCSRDISRMIFEMFPNCKIRLSYGSTETFCPTTSYVTKEMIAERPELATSIGKINAQNEIRLVDAKTMMYRMESRERHLCVRQCFSEGI